MTSDHYDLNIVVDHLRIVAKVKWGCKKVSLPLERKSTVSKANLKNMHVWKHAHIVMIVSNERFTGPTNLRKSMETVIRIAMISSDYDDNVTKKSVDNKCIF